MATLAALVNEFSQFVRFPTAKLTPTDTNTTVHEAIEVFSGRLEGIQIKTTLEQNLPAIRADGLIVKADSSLLPIDSMYASDATNRSGPMIASSESAFGNQRAQYVFAYPRTGSEEGVTVSLSSLQISGPVFAYDWVTHSGELLPEGGSLRMKFADGWDYQILSAVNRKGLALLGDTDKIVSLGKQRIAALEDHGDLTVTVKFARGEDLLTISGYASHLPKLKALQGKLADTAYDPQTKIFRAQVAPAESGQAILQVIAP